MKSYTVSTLDLANITSSQGFRVRGTKKGDNTGWSVAGGGDINCDGIKDFAVSAPHAGAGTDPNSGTGTTYLIFGEKGRNISEILINGTLPSNIIEITGGISYEESGFTLNLNTDLNNDKCNELVIGAPFANSGYTYIVKGSKDLPSKINLNNLGNLGITMIGNTKYYGGGFGYSIAAVGDMDNNGYQDLLIGAPWAAKGYLIYFNESMPNTIDLGKISPDEILVMEDSTSTNFARSLDSAGDFNKDGNLDLLFGDPSKNLNAGAAYILSGSGKKITGTIDISKLDSTQLTTFNGAPDSWLGEAISYAGDINGDGVGDVLIATGVSLNQVYLVYGNQKISAPFTFEKNAFWGVIFYGDPQSNFGISVKGNIDINGDGLKDFIVGAWYENNYQGSVYCFFGNKNLPYSIYAYNLDKTYGFRIDGPSSNSGIGRNVGGGDVDDDGIDDILISDSNEESAFVVYGTQSNSITKSPTLTPTTAPSLAPTILPTSMPSSNFNIFNITKLSPKLLNPLSNSKGELGYMVSSAGDFNGDGNIDYIVGAPQQEESNSIGTVYLVLGESNNNLTLSSELASTGQGFSIVGGYYLGYSLTGIGDFNGDGYDDIAMAAPCQYVYVIYGKENNFKNIDVSGNYIDPNDGFMIRWKYQISGNPYIAVAGIGDYNKDGLKDIAIAGDTYNFDSFEVNLVVVFGAKENSNIDLTNLDLATIGRGYTILGIQPDYFSTGDHNTKTISSAGDFNNDGYADFLFGAYNIAYLINGGNSYTNFNISDLSADKGFNITCSTKNCYLGVSVSDAGDVNGDGKADILVAGTHLAAVIYGTDSNDIASISVNDLGTLGVTITLDQPINVVGSGNFNYDDYSDILIGSKSGTVYVIYGEQQNNNITIYQNHMNGGTGYAIVDPSTNSLFGSTLSTIKNSNEDELDGIIIGAPQADNNDGKAYVVMVNSSSNFPTHFPTSAPTDNTGAKHLRVNDKILEKTIIPVGIVFLAAAGYYTHKYCYFKHHHTSNYGYTAFQTDPRPSAPLEPLLESSAPPYINFADAVSFGEYVHATVVEVLGRASGTGSISDVYGEPVP